MTKKEMNCSGMKKGDKVMFRWQNVHPNNSSKVQTPEYGKVYTIRHVVVGIIYLEGVTNPIEPQYGIEYGYSQSDFCLEEEFIQNT